MQCHIHLSELIIPIKEDIAHFKWFLSDLEFMPGIITELPINHKSDSFILDETEFNELVVAEPQIIWGAILGFHRDAQIMFYSNNLPC